MKNILIAGGSGLIGNELVKKLNEKNFETIILSRNKLKVDNKTIFYWNPDKDEIDINAFENVDTIINLTGENISTKRWTNSQKLIIEKSRTESTNLLFETVKSNNSQVKTYISASAIGFYGTYNSDKIFTENDVCGTDFLASVCEKWENAAKQFSEIVERTIIFRTGVVFSKKAGAFPKLIESLKFRTIAILGNGKQQVPFIHIDDLVEMYVFAIENNQMNGIYNAVSPSQKTNLEIMTEIQKQTNFWTFKIFIPSIFMKIILGEMASILLYGSKVSSEKIQKSGFQFKYFIFKNSTLI